MRRFNHSISLRALSVIALSIVGVALVAGISTGATTFLTKQKAKRLFYTKAQSDNRFAPKSALMVEGWRLVQSPGQPSFNESCLDAGEQPVPCWVNFGSVHNPVGFYKDPLGVVHLRGIADCFGACLPAPNGSARIFTLPDGYHPAAQEAVAALSSVAGNIARIDVTSGGQVVLRGPQFLGDWVSLDGISFRAA
jgi:hypothetical protein